MKTEKDYEDLRVLDARIEESGVPLESIIRTARLFDRTITALRWLWRWLWVRFAVLYLLLGAAFSVYFAIGLIWYILSYTWHQIYLAFFQ
jgi:hypothetical protein